MLLKVSQNSRENTCVRVSFIKKESLKHVSSYEFCKIFKTTYFIEHLRSVLLLSVLLFFVVLYLSYISVITHTFNTRQLETLNDRYICFFCLCFHSYFQFLILVFFRNQLETILAICKRNYLKWIGERQQNKCVTGGCKNLMKHLNK